MTQVADAIRTVTVRVQQAIEDGHRSRVIDADDLVEVLLAIADELDAPVAEPPALDAPGCVFCREAFNRPDERFECPYCHAVWDEGAHP
jgi:hypothetical protein